MCDLWVGRRALWQVSFLNLRLLLSDTIAGIFRVCSFTVRGSLIGPDQGTRSHPTSPYSKNKELVPSVTQVSYPLTSHDKTEMLSYRGVMYASDDSDSDTHFTSWAVTQGLQTVRAIPGSSSTHAHTHTHMYVLWRTSRFFKYKAFCFGLFLACHLDEAYCILGCDIV
jgi:hypothetical protein